MKFRLTTTIVLGLLALFISGCSIKSSYPSDTIKQAFQEICRTEYGIEEVQVEVRGSTIGVYLPLERLFAADFKEAALGGKVRNLEHLFEPSPEALEKVEDVLFSISRVLLSSDEQFQFYVLLATDVEQTGLQLVLSGFVDDIKRVRIWDISRDEYRKRVIHELRLSRSVKWHQPVRHFFRDLEKLSPQAIQSKYFGDALPVESIRTLFYEGGNDLSSSQQKWVILDIRSTPFQKGEILIYAKVKAPYEMKGLEDEAALQYLFMVSLMSEEPRLIRIIPFQYQGKDGYWNRIPFPEELTVEKNMENWEEEFTFEEIKLGPFLARQLTKRAQILLTEDERVHNTFRQSKLEFQFLEEPKPPHFALDVQAHLREFNEYSKDSIARHEDMIYLLTAVFREFVHVLRSYRFGDYSYLSLHLAQESVPWVLGRDSLELFRKKKIDLQGLLSVPQL